jgi:hypothetical protein
LASRNDTDLRAKADIQPLIPDGFLDLQAPVLQSDTVIDDQFWLVKSVSCPRIHHTDSNQGGLVLGRTSVGISGVWRAIVPLITM